MTTKFVEGDLSFEFGNRWTHLFHWDRHPLFFEGMAKANQGKAVDFCGVLDNRVPFLFEIKDYRTALRNPEKMELAHEIELKVRSTVAALFGLRWRDKQEACVHAFETLRAARKPRVVLWHEGPAAKDELVRLGVLSETISKCLAWLDAQALAASTQIPYDSIVPDISVQVLPPARRQKIDRITEILKRRGKVVGQDLVWRIEEITDLLDLDLLMQRASTVREAWNLFSR